MSHKPLPAVGIDFGTTNSAIALAAGTGKPHILQIDPNSPNPQVLRSLLYLKPDQSQVFGQQAISAYLADISTGTQVQKRLIATGKKFKLSRFSAGGYAGEEWIPVVLEVEENQNGRLIQSMKTALSSTILGSFDLFGKPTTIEEIISHILGEIKHRAESVARTTLCSAVIGRPVHFIGNNDTLAENRLRKAAELAGFKEVQFEFEPVGAAWNYGLGTGKSGQTIFVFDFGGGTLDFTIVRFPQKEILATRGLPIGGDLINSQIFMTKLAKYFGLGARYGLTQLEVPESLFDNLKNWYQISLLKRESFLGIVENFRYQSSDPGAIKALESLVNNNLGFALYEEIDRAKIALSNQSQTPISLAGPDIEIKETLTREEFENILGDFLVEIEEGIKETISNAKLKATDINYVVTTGGSSLIPVIQRLLARFFGETKIIRQEAFTSVAAGLALRCRDIMG